MEHNYLPLFITEEVYLIKGDSIPTEEPQEVIQEQPVSKKETPPAAPTKVEEPSVVPTPKISIPKKETPVMHEMAIWCPPLSPADKDLLTKILQAIKKDINQANIMEGLEAYSPYHKNLLCFGYQNELNAKAGTSIEMYTPTQFPGKKVLTAVAPGELHSDPAQKKRLWEALQRMFL